MTLVTLLSTVVPQDEARASHPHDCDCCTFVGNILREGDEYRRDVYVCGGKSTEGASEAEMTLITRFGENGEYESFPLYAARCVGKADPDFHRWPQAVKLYDQWVAAGCPDHTAEHLSSEEFFAQFSHAASMDVENYGDGEQYGARLHVVGITRRVNQKSVERFLEARYYATHCTHEHDCCGHTYRDAPTWSYAPGLQDRVILIRQGWRVNI